MKKDNKGFTLVELIIVIAIIAILGVVAAPQYIKYVEESREATDEQAFDELAHAAGVAYAELATKASFDEKVNEFELKLNGNKIAAETANALSTATFGIYGDYEPKSSYYTTNIGKVKIKADGTWEGRNTAE